LEKDPRQRLRDIGDWQRLLRDAGPPPGSPRRRWLVPMAAALLVIAAGAAGLQFGRRSFLAPAADWQLSLAPPPGGEFLPVGNQNGSTPEISPDGSMAIARTMSGPVLRRVNSTEWLPLKGAPSFGSPVLVAGQPVRRLLCARQSIPDYEDAGPGRRGGTHPGSSRDPPRRIVEPLRADSE
jgi:hypothetical protein